MIDGRLPESLESPIDESILNKFKLLQVEEAVRLWINKQGHDSCWYYPEIFKNICKILNIDEVEQNLPERCEFEKGCEKY